MQKPALNVAIAAITDQFVKQLAAIYQESINQAMKAALAGAAIPGAKRGRGRPPKNSLPLFSLGTPAPAKKRKAVYCPVPGCKGLAAPVFGMVCTKHKDVDKAKIKQYREAKRKREEK